MTKNMLDLANAMHRNERANAGTAAAETNAVMQELRDRMAALQQ